jgi:integrase/recombinase XerC
VTAPARVVRADRAVASNHEAALAACERDLRRLNRAPAFVTQVGAVARAFLARSARLVAEITRDDVRAFLAERRPLVSASTQVTELGRLRSFFQALARLRLVPDDPTLAVRLAPAPPPVHLLLTEADVQRLLAAADAAPGADPRVRALALRDRAALELLYCGLRSAEVRAALVTDFDRREGALLVRRAKGGRPDLLPLPRPTAALLRRYLGARPRLAGDLDPRHLVLREDGLPFARASTVNRLVSRVARKAGVKVHPHALRRAIASHLVERGVPVPLVQRYLGHERIASTQLYVEVERAALRRAVETLKR